MLKWLVSGIIIVGVGVQIIFFPWLSIFSNQAPIALVIVLISSFIRGNYTIPTAIGAGLLLDLQGGHIPGFWTLYYLLAAALLVWLQSQANFKWWWRLIWLVAVLILQYWYGQIPDPNWSWTSLMASLLVAGIVGILALGPCYWLRKRELLS